MPTPSLLLPPKALSLPHVHIKVDRTRELKIQCTIFIHILWSRNSIRKKKAPNNSFCIPIYHHLASYNLPRIFKKSSLAGRTHLVSTRKRLFIDRCLEQHVSRSQNIQWNHTALSVLDRATLPYPFHKVATNPGLFALGWGQLTFLIFMRHECVVHKQDVQINYQRQRATRIAMKHPW